MRNRQLPFTVTVYHPDDEIDHAFDVPAELQSAESSTIRVIARRKLDGRVLAAVRVETNEGKPLAVENILPPAYKRMSLAEVTWAMSNTSSPAVHLAIMKALHAALRMRIDVLVLNRAGSVSAFFERFMPETIRCQDGLTLTAKVRGFEIESTKALWARAGHPMAQFLEFDHRPEIANETPAKPTFLADVHVPAPRGLSATESSGFLRRLKVV